MLVIIVSILRTIGNLSCSQNTGKYSPSKGF